MSRLLCLLATILVLPWPRGELCEQSNSASRSQSTSDGSATLPTDPPVLLNDFGGSGGHSGAEYSGVGLSGNELSGEGLSGVGQSGDEQSRTGDTLSGDPFSGSGVQRAVTEGLPGNEAGGEIVSPTIIIDGEGTPLPTTSESTPPTDINVSNVALQSQASGRVVIGIAVGVGLGLAALTVVALIIMAIVATVSYMVKKKRRKSATATYFEVPADDENSSPTNWQLMRERTRSDYVPVPTTFTTDLNNATLQD